MIAAVAFALAVIPPAETSDWSRFRGPNGSGSDTTGLPAEFGPALG